MTGLGVHATWMSVQKVASVCCLRQSCVNSWSSCLLQSHTYPFSRETTVNQFTERRDRQSAFVGQSNWVSCAHTQVHMFVCLFVRMCLHTPTRSLVWHYAGHYAGSIPAKHACTRPRIHAIFGFKVTFDPRSHVDLRLPLVDFLGGVTCNVSICSSQWHCAGSIVVKHACTQPRIHAIQGFKVTFSCTLLIMQLLCFLTLSVSTFVTCETAPVNYVVSNALQSSNHAQGSTLMRFVTLFVSV